MHKLVNVQSYSNSGELSPLAILFSNKFKKFKISGYKSELLAISLGAIVLLSNYSQNEIELDNELQKIDSKSYISKNIINYYNAYEPTNEEIEYAKKEYSEWFNTERTVETEFSIDSDIVLDDYAPNLEPQFNYSIRDLKKPNNLNLKYFSDTMNLSTPSIEQLDEIAKVYGLNGSILEAVMLKESNGDCSKTSHKGAKGCFQFLDKTATEFSLSNIKNGFASADTAARYLLYLNKRINGDKADINNLNNLQYALAAYNAGLSNVLKISGKRIPNFPETIDYVDDIIGYLDGKKHYVKRGELIHEIIEKYNIDEETLFRSNLFKIGDNDDLKWGEFLSIEDRSNEEIHIEVTKGINLYRTSIKTGVSIDEIMSYNKIEDPSNIKIGQKIIIPPMKKIQILAKQNRYQK